MTTRKIDGLRPEVLLLSNERDLSLDWVVRELRQRGVHYVRLNTERCTRFTWAVDPADARWRLEDAGQLIDLARVRSILYRRPEPPTLPRLAGSDRRLARGQWAALIAGLSSLDAKWISSPHMISRAESKVLQLRTAVRLGLTVPKSLVTNSGSAARTFAQRIGTRVVIKALDTPIVGPRSKEGFVFSSLLASEQLAEVSETELAPFIVQQPITPKLDVRVTVVGSRVFAARCTADTFDWRRQDPPPAFEPFELGSGQASKAMALVKEFGLLFGALDFVVDRDGRWYFLELNPNGEWGWLQRSGSPIAQAIVDELTTSPSAPPEA